MFKLSGQGLQRVQDFKGHADQVESLAWNPDVENQFASTSVDKTIKIWDAKAGKVMKTEKTKQENLNLQFNPLGTILAVSNMNDDLCFYDVRMFKIVKQIKFKNEVNDFTWDRSPEGNTILVADSSGTVTLLDG